MLRMSAFVSLALALCCLVASLIFVLPPLLAARSPDLPGSPRLLQLLPLAAAALGMLGGALGLFASPAPVDHPMPEASRFESAGEDAVAPTVAGLQAAMEQLYTLLTEERAEVGAWREVCSKGTQEAMDLSDRLAAVAADLETRLSAGVAQVESALRNPAGAATRAAEATLRVERALARTETALRALPEASTAASNAAASLRQETAGLIAAAQQVSAAQTNALQSQAASPADRSPGDPGPNYAEEMTGLASRLTATLETAVETLSDGRQALDTAGQHVVAAGEKAAVRLTEMAEATLRQLATAAKEAPTARAVPTADLPQPVDLSELATITESLKSTASHLSDTIADGTQSIHQAGAQVSANSETAAATLRELAAQSLARLSAAATLPELPQLASLTASLQTTAERLADGTRELTEAGQRSVATGQTNAEKLSALVEKSMLRLSAAADAMAARPESATAEAPPADFSGLTDVAAELKSTAATLADHAGALDHTGRVLLAAGQAVAQQVGATGATVAQRIDGAESSLRQQAEAATAQLAAAALELVTAGQAAAQRVSGAAETAAQRIDGAESALRQQAGAAGAQLAAASVDLAAVAQAAAQGVSATGEVVAQRLDTVERGLREQATAVAAQLATATQDLMAAGQAAVQGVSATGELAVRSIGGAELGLREQAHAVAAQLAAATQGLVVAGQVAAQGVGAAGESVVQRIDGAEAGLREQADVVAAQLATATQDLVAAGQTTALRVGAAGESVVQRIDGAELGLREQADVAAAQLATATQDLVAAGQTTAQRVGAAGESVVQRIDGAELGLREQAEVAAAQLATATQDLVAATQRAAQGVSATGESVVRRIDGAELGLRQQQAALAGTTQLIREASSDAAKAINVAAARIATAANTVKHEAAALGAANVSTAPGGVDAIVETARQAMDELHEAIDLLRVVGRQVGDSAPDSASTADRPAVAHEAAAPLVPDLTELTSLTTTLGAAAATLVDGMSALDAAARRVVASGDAVAERLASTPQPALTLVPELSAAISAASAGLAQDAAVLTQAAQQISMQLAAKRGDTTPAELAQSGRIIAAAAEEVSQQIGRLAGIAAHAETQAATLPGLTAQIAETAARLEAAASGDAVQTTLAPALRHLADLAAGIGAAVGRMETALAHHDESGAEIASAMAQVQSTLAASMAVAQDRPPSAATPVAATLRHLDAVSRETELLLAQTEALAEAVVGGQAPDLPGQLAVRAPELLAEVEATIRRLQSVATAVALASDGPPMAERRAV